VLVTGFGSFEEVEVNPSREVARRLAADSSGNTAGSGGLRFVAAELPVSFRRVPEAVDRFFESHVADLPELFLALGVQPEPWFRLESRARARLSEEERPDVDGVSAAEVEPYAGTTRTTKLDLERIVTTLRERGVSPVATSEDAGGYVCERTYYRVLEHADRTGVPGLFVHVPPAGDVPIERQVEVVRWIAELALR